MSDRDRLWASFLRTRVRVFDRDGPGATTEILIGAEAEPADGDRAGLVQLITAWNPWGEPLPLRRNKTRQEELERRLDDAGHQWVPAAGVAEDGAWAEAGVAISAIGREDALDIGRQWEQEAIYEWDPAGGRIAVVSCRDHRVWTRLATAQTFSTRPCPLRAPADRALMPCDRPDDEFRQTMLWALGCDVCRNGGFRRRL
jgi:hypothetical protein